jgi:hypothetical protein
LYGLYWYYDIENRKTIEITNHDSIDGKFKVETAFSGYLNKINTINISDKLHEIF